LKIKHVVLNAMRDTPRQYRGDVSLHSYQLND
jgi:hypothetical protein